MKKLVLAIILSVISFAVELSAQEKPRFWDDVQVIKQYDNLYAPPAHPILFIGSSSIRKWDDLESTFADFVVMNRGIGGAVVNDIIYYAKDIVFPYQPRQIVIYVGEDDIVNDATTADSIFIRTKHLVKIIRSKLPEVPIIYISIKPSPSREKYIDKAIAANTLISNYILTEKNIRFLDIFHPMLNAEGKPIPELFQGDMLHMNLKGYAIWRKAIKPLLLRK
ncbi:MAG: GDSL-type esterase/lipase family protein [Paludibacter sp.]|nr:GDSL-type esterase/lipase family protein [Paludibacter sp.]